MHRSGTSLLASWMEKCGLRIHDGRLVKPSPSNPRGYFEDEDFVGLHASTIYQKVAKSDSWKVFGSNSLKFSNDKLSEARRLIGKRNARYALWGWKDPRSVFFLDQWKEIIPELKVLLVWRPCLETVYSLVRRRKTAKTTLTEPVRLWISYNKKICEYKRNHPDCTILSPLDYIIRHDKEFFGILKKKLQVDLKYYPINTVYDQSLMHKKPASLTRLINQMLLPYYQSTKTEKVLIGLSDTC